MIGEPGQRNLFEKTLLYTTFGMASEQLPLPDFLIPTETEPSFRDQPPRTPLRIVDNG
jgi:hypothetical protein